LVKKEVSKDLSSLVEEMLKKIHLRDNLIKALEDKVKSREELLS